MKVIFLLIFVLLPICAKTINMQIHALEHATPEERVSLMNSIKQKLVMMHENERVQTLGVLKARLHQVSGEEHNYNQRKENVGSHLQHDSHEMMHQDMKGSHTLHHNINAGSAGHSNNCADKANHDSGGRQSSHENGGDKATRRNGKGGNAAHEKKHSMAHVKAYENHSRDK